MIELFKGHIRLSIEEPYEGYCGTRFDWTGKIIQLWWKNIPICTSEFGDRKDAMQGLGFFNEFGIDKAIGYDKCRVGNCFPKIGVGMLQKESNDPYDFFHQYKCVPFEFVTKNIESGVSITTTNLLQPHSFVLEKKIHVTSNGFTIDYELKNLGETDIVTTEYVHNFLSPGQRKLSDSLKLTLGATINKDQFESGINPNSCVSMSNNQFSWSHVPKSDFFFENIAETLTDSGSWMLTDRQLHLSITERVNFKPHKINLWGRAHVVSPELFKNINLKPGETERWQRVFEIQEIESAID